MAERIIDADRAYKLLSEVVRKFGEDFVYTRPEAGNKCFYAFAGKPSCIVGQALALAGWTYEELCGLDCRHNTSASELYEWYPELITWGASHVFGAAQVEQDHGSAWEVALNAAHEALLSAKRNEPTNANGPASSPAA